MVAGTCACDKSKLGLETPNDYGLAVPDMGVGCLGGMQGSCGGVHLPLWPGLVFLPKPWLPDVGGLEMLAALAVLPLSNLLCLQPPRNTSNVPEQCNRFLPKKAAKVIFRSHRAGMSLGWETASVLV